MDLQTLKSVFPDTLIEANHPLAPDTTVNIGGPADIFIHTKSTEELVNILKYLSETGNFSEHGVEHSEIPTINGNCVARSAQPEGSAHRKNSPVSVIILGNGSNVLISDTGIRGIVIKNSASSIEYLADNQVKVNSGVQLPQLITDSIDHSLSGLEEFAYIPSTIGGAVAGNIHGVNKNNFDKFLVSVDVFNLQTGVVENYPNFPNLPHLIIISATLRLTSGNPARSKLTVIDIIAQKTAVQSMNSLGSVFKNPPNDSAGRIIDKELNLSGFRLGDVQISPKHANFILNLGHATALNYLTVIKKIQFEALAKGFTLEPEIKFLGEF